MDNLTIFILFFFIIYFCCESPAQISPVDQQLHNQAIGRSANNQLTVVSHDTIFDKGVAYGIVKIAGGLPTHRSYRIYTLKGEEVIFITPDRVPATGYIYNFRNQDKSIAFYPAFHRLNRLASIVVEYDLLRQDKLNMDNMHVFTEKYPLPGQFAKPQDVKEDRIHIVERNRMEPVVISGEKIIQDGKFIGKYIKETSNIEHESNVYLIHTMNNQLCARITIDTSASVVTVVTARDNVKHELKDIKADLIPAIEFLVVSLYL